MISPSGTSSWTFAKKGFKLESRHSCAEMGERIAPNPTSRTNLNGTYIKNLEPRLW
jgi:hypothetical protein